ncbi:PilZ domain-containing protein [Sphingobium sp. CAP-1]|uniref:PilZ domain-containing protein n=1 Tax=Sphingobium sp. CAP-1 TaxID=2676077 RepID=UPI0012BB3F9F|nr:PilZ domain-containing protein [Sphingobium sp. CAP-1]QGP77687.1 hypothetical protein GL174_00765 [Sphingobium sp. CAP-1]
MTGSYRTRLHRFYRAARRQQLQRVSTLRADDGAPVDVLLEDVSMSGCRISGAVDLTPGEAIWIGLAGVGTRAARIIWAESGRAGCHFIDPLSAAEFDQTHQASSVVATLFPARPAPAFIAPAEPEDAPRPSRAGLKPMLLAALFCGGLVAVLIGWRIALS